MYMRRMSCLEIRENMSFSPFSLAEMPPYIPTFQSAHTHLWTIVLENYNSDFGFDFS